MSSYLKAYGSVTMPYSNNDIVHVCYRCLIMCFFNMKSAAPRKRIDDTYINKKRRIPSNCDETRFVFL